MLQVLIWIFLWCKPVPTGPIVFEARVKSIHDGDTVKLDSESGLISVRLVNIDAPELRQPDGYSSAQFLRTLLTPGQLVRVESQGWDKYHRVLGRITTMNGLCVNEAMVRAGQAWVYRAYCKDKAYYEFEKQARADGLGIWKGVPIPPWDYRHHAWLKTQKVHAK